MEELYITAGNSVIIREDVLIDNKYPVDRIFSVEKTMYSPDNLKCLLIGYWKSNLVYKELGVDAEDVDFFATKELWKKMK